MELMDQQQPYDDFQELELMNSSNDLPAEFPHFR